MARFTDMFEAYNVTPNRFIRTSKDEDHLKSVTAVWNKLKSNGQINKGTHRGWYSVREERYISPKEIEQEATQNETEVQPGVFNGEQLQDVEERNYILTDDNKRAETAIEKWIGDGAVWPP